MAEGGMTLFRLCRSSGLFFLGTLSLVISHENILVHADTTQRAEQEVRILPRVKEFDELTGQYFEADGAHTGCLSVFTSSNVLTQENFGCCPGARGLAVRPSLFWRDNPAL